MTGVQTCALPILGGVNNSSIDKLNELSNSLEKLANLGEINLSGAIRGISKLSQAIGSITLSSVENLEDTVSALERMGNLGNIPVPNMRNLTASTGGATTATPGANPTTSGGNVEDRVDEVNRYTDATSRAANATSYWKSQLTSAGQSISSAYGNAFRGMVQGVSSFGNAIRNIPSKALSSLATIPLKVASGFKKAVSVVATFASKLKEVASSAISAGIGRIKNSISGLTSSLSMSNSKLGHFITSLGRIAMYRTVRFIISQTTQAIKDGVNNLYEWSKVADGRFSASMDRMATSCQYLKNS